MYRNLVEIVTLLYFKLAAVKVWKIDLETSGKFAKGNGMFVDLALPANKLNSNPPDVTCVTTPTIKRRS